jgi:hypothetical protein
MKAQWYKNPLFWMLLAALCTGVVAWVLMAWHVRTRIEVSLTVDSLSFTVGGANRLTLLNSVPVQSLMIQKFAQIELSPDVLEVEDSKPSGSRPNQMEKASATTPWKSLPIQELPIVVTKTKDTAAVALRNAKPDMKTLGILDRIWVSPGSVVTLTEVWGAKKINLTVRSDGQKTIGHLFPSERFQLMTSHCRIAALPNPAAFMAYRTQLPPYSPSVDFTSQKGLLEVTAAISPETATELFPRGGFPVTAITFSKQDQATGRQLTTLVKGGELTYPKYPKIEKVKTKDTDFLRLEKLRKFRIEKMSMNPKSAGIQLHLNGEAEYIGIGSPEFFKDYTLTRFDILWHDKLLIVFVLIVGAVFTILERLYRLHKDYRS